MISSEQIITENREQAVLVVDVSGGKDSIRMLRFLGGKFPAIPTYCVMRAPACSTLVRFQRWTGHGKWPHGLVFYCALFGTQATHIWRWFGTAVSLQPRNSNSARSTRCAVRSKDSSADCPIAW